MHTTLRQQGLQSPERHATERTDQHRPAHVERQCAEPTGQCLGHGLPGSDRRRGPFRRDQHALRIGDQQLIGQHPDHTAEQDAQTLRHGLTARCRADGVPDLEVVEQIGALPGGAAGGIGAHQVHRHLSGGEHTKTQLRQLPDGTNRRNAGGADHPSRNRRQQQRQRNRQQRQAGMNAEQAYLQHHHQHHRKPEADSRPQRHSRQAPVAAFRHGARAQQAYA